MAGIGVTSQPIRIVVKDGYATDISGGGEAEQLIALLEPHGRDGRNVAEFGIGTNDRARLSGVILEDEKVMGTIHIAFGDNKSMGGTRARRQSSGRSGEAADRLVRRSDDHGRGAAVDRRLIT